MEAVPVVGSKILSTAADHHLGMPFSRLVQSIAHIKVVLLLALVVSIANQDVLSITFHFADLIFGGFSLA